jgi:hypothetical protein
MADETANGFHMLFWEQARFHVLHSILVLFRVGQSQKVKLLFCPITFWHLFQVPVKSFDVQSIIKSKQETVTKAPLQVFILANAGGHCCLHK